MVEMECKHRIEGIHRTNRFLGIESCIAKKLSYDMTIALLNKAVVILLVRTTARECDMLRIAPVFAEPVHELTS